MIGGEEKEEVKDAVADELKVEDAPQEKAFEDEQDETHDEEVTGEDEGTIDEIAQDVYKQDQNQTLNQNKESAI